MNAGGDIALHLHGHEFRPKFSTWKPSRIGLLTLRKLIHGSQYFGRFCHYLKHALCFLTGKFLIPAGTVGSGSAFRHGQVEPRSSQQGEHLRLHFFKCVILRVFLLVFSAKFPRLMA